MRVLCLLFFWGKSLRPGLVLYIGVTHMVPIAPYPKDHQSSIQGLEAPSPEGDGKIKVPSSHIHPLDAGPLTGSSLDVGFRSPGLEDLLAGKWECLPAKACRNVCTRRKRVGMG